MRANTAAADPYGTAIVPLRGGGIDRAFRGICVISVALTELLADPKCQFSGFSLVSRCTIRREYCTNCHKCTNNCDQRESFKACPVVLLRDCCESNLCAKDN